MIKTNKALILTFALTAAAATTAFADGTPKCYDAKCFNPAANSGPEPLAYCNQTMADGRDGAAIRVELTLQSPSKISVRVGPATGRPVFEGNMTVPYTSDPFLRLSATGGSGSEISLWPQGKGMFDRQHGGLFEGYIMVPTNEHAGELTQLKLTCKMKVSALARISSRLEKEVSVEREIPGTKCVTANPGPTVPENPKDTGRAQTHNPAE